MDAENMQQLAEHRRRERMARIDALPADVRELVHEYGYHIVNMLMSLGVKKPRQIEHVVETILDEFSPTRGSFSQQGIRTEVGAPKPSQQEPT